MLKEMLYKWNTAAAIINWTSKNLVKARCTPPILSQKGALNQSQKDISISKTF